MLGRTDAGLAGVALTAVSAAAIMSCPTRADAGEAKPKVDLAALIRETQKMSPKANEIRLAWWIPVEYWEACLSQNPMMTPEQIDQVVKVVSPYTLLAVVEGDVGPFGGIAFKDEATVRSRVKLRDKDESAYSPLKPDKISPDASNLLAAMKPILANAMGPLGKNMHFFLFPAKDEKGRRIADAKKKGSFSVLVGEKKYKWRLPLGSLLPPKTCPECAEKLSGAFKFCPYDGTKLTETKE